jgi:amino acid transporter
MPTAGGDYDYLTAAYGQYAGFAFAWYNLLLACLRYLSLIMRELLFVLLPPCLIAICLYIYCRGADVCAAIYGRYYFWINKPGSQAIIATVFGQYVLAAARMSPSTFGSGSEAAAADSHEWAATLLAVLLVTGLFAVNCLGVRVSATLNNCLATVKLLLVCALLVSGAVFVASRSSENSSANLSFPDSFSGTGGVRGVGTGMIACLWAFEGWWGAAALYLIITSEQLLLHHYIPLF